MIELWINYWHGDFFVGIFPSIQSAQEHFEKHKENYRDYKGEKHGFPYATPYYVYHHKTGAV